MDPNREMGRVEKLEVCDGAEYKLLVSVSSSDAKPWWHSTRSTKSSFSRQVSVGMFLRTRYWRRSLTFKRISRGR